MPQAVAWFVGAMIVLVPFLFLATINLDRLIRRLHDLHPEAWRQAGSPRGFFWKPSGGKSVSEMLAFEKCALTWGFRLPPALAGDFEARQIQLRMRVGLLVWNAGVLALVGTLLYLFTPGSRG